MNLHTASMESRRRKRLGQFFSGSKVGRVLAAIADARSAATIIDPMVGHGDLLRACLDIGASPQIITGIEIDTAAATEARRLVEGAVILNGSAFDPGVIAKLPISHYDLVIGNPPYVRYQDGSCEDDGIPSASMVRRHLTSSIALLEYFDDHDRGLLANAVAAYSGHADLAVPACLLSMALVAPAGCLALVLPQAWLARNYASTVRHCLDKMFDVDVIVEDDGASWFPDALVKTSLLVARRKSSRHRSTTATNFHVHLGRGAGNDVSVVGNVMNRSAEPELAFAAALRTGFSTSHGSSIIQVSNRAKSLEDEAASFQDPALRLIATQLALEPCRTVTLGGLGVVIGQGLRTGANDFFYVQPSDDSAGFMTPLCKGPVSCPSDLLRPAVRDQRGRRDAVLDLRRVVLPEDARSAPGHYEVMPQSLAEHVRRASTILSGKPGRERPIPDLSAVRTNVRPARRDAPPRFWYMLPDFQPRHLPDAYLARVCASQPTPCPSDRSVLVDANFITFRCAAAMPVEALLAILHSNWVWAWLETAGAVMGGGALKIESTMLERLPIPSLGAEQIEQLKVLWLFTCRRPSHDYRRAIDAILLEKVKPTSSLLDRLRLLALARQHARMRTKV